MTGLESVIDGIIARGVRPPAEGDYECDGLLYCAKCNTKKQTRVELFGIEKIVPCICHCREMEIKAEEEHRKQIELRKQIAKYRAIGFPEAEMREWTFANDDNSNQQVSTACRNYVDKYETFRENGKGLLLYGPVGTGKTFAAACIANALIDRCVPVLLTSVMRIANTLQGLFEGRQEYIDSLNRFDLLILDDLAAERKTEFMNEIVYNIIDSRYRSKKPLIVTTNLTADAIKNTNDIANGRTYSRLLEMCFPLEVTGKDKRRANLISDYAETKAMLGL